MPWLERSWKFRTRFGFRFTLAIVIGVLAWSALMRIELDRQLDDRLSGYAADIQRGNVRINHRLAGLANEENEARALIMARVAELASDQEDFRLSGLHAPFGVEGLLPAVVQVICVDGSAEQKYYAGSGTVIDKSGLILTNHHVLVNDAGKMIRLCGIGVSGDLTKPPKISYLARAEASDADGDLALLKIFERLDGSEVGGDFAALDVSGASTLAGAMKIGDPVYIGGYPSVGADTLTMTQGVVAGRVGDDLIKTSAYLDSGASGGAAFDSRGRFIGVPAAAARGEIGGSLGYLIGGPAVQAFLDDYRAGRNLVKTVETLKR